MTVNLAKVSPTKHIASGREPEAEEIAVLLNDAVSFLTSFSWCKRIEGSYTGIAIPGVVGVFLFNIDPSEPEVDDWVWVVVGDIPPAYLVTDQAPNPACALRAYIDEMMAWVEAVKAGRPVVELIPVNVPPTFDHAAALERRLKLLGSEVLSGYEEDLREC